MKTAAVGALLLALLVPGAAAAQQPNDPLAAANRLFESREYRAAADVYQALLRQQFDVPTRAKVWFNLGLTYQRLKRHDDAIAAFREIFRLDVNDREPGGHIMEPYRNYRSRAQWEVGQSLFAKGDYKGALQAYLTTKSRYPLQSWCNVEEASAQQMYAFHEGLTYEHLGAYRQAVAAYLRIYDPRLIDLYETAGQLADLRRFVDRARAPLSQAALEYHSSQNLHDMLEIHRMAERREWSQLMTLFRTWSHGSGNGRQKYLARTLARYPQETLPLMLDELSSVTSPRALVYETLGYMRTPEAVTILKERAEKEEGAWASLWLVQALRQSGTSGAAALTDLESRATGSMRITIGHLRSGLLDDLYGSPVTFPAIPAKLSLPRF